MSEMTFASIVWSAVWFLVHMMKPGFIPNDDAIQEVITFTIVPLQKTGADAQAVVPLLSCQMFGHPPCRNSVEPKIVMH
jgi:hypothetical protein